MRKRISALRSAATMQLPRLQIVVLMSVFVAFASLLIPHSLAQSYPAKPIRMLVGLAAGGATDVTARIVAQSLSEDLGQSVIVENRTGADGSIAIERLISLPADGYTVLMMGISSVIQSSLRSKLPYDLERDLAPISLVAVGSQGLVVHPSTPAQDVSALISLARTRPGKLSYGSDGMAGAGHLAGELFKFMAKVNIAHVAYRGGSEAAFAVAGGHIEAVFLSITAVLPVLEAKKVRALAVTTAKRASLMPEVPTLSESGLPGYDFSSWQGVLAHAGVPKEIIVRLNSAIDRVANAPDVTNALKKQGREVRTTTPDQFSELIRRELAQNAKLMKAIGLRVD